MIRGQMPVGVKKTRQDKKQRDHVGAVFRGKDFWKRNMSGR
jgi:hypothetical protein